MIERVECCDIRMNPQKANNVLSMEIDKVNNDIYICLVGNATTFAIDETTKDSLNHLYRELSRYKNEGKF